ncbi:hypothetical protein D3C81_1881760 [compost metagenome]
MIDLGKVARERRVDVVVEKGKPSRGFQVSNVLWSSGVEVIDTDDVVSILDQSSAQVRSKKSCTASNNDCCIMHVVKVIMTIVEMTIFNHLLRS